MLQKQRSAPGSARWLGLQEWHLSQTGTQLPGGTVPPAHQTGRGKRGGDVTDHTTRGGTGTTTPELSPALPPSLCLLKQGTFGKTGPDGTLETGKRSQWGFKRAMATPVTERGQQNASELEEKQRRGVAVLVNESFSGKEAFHQTHQQALDRQGKRCKAALTC